MFAGSENGRTNALRKRIRETVIAEAVRQKASNFTFLDEMYRALAARMAAIRGYGSLRHDHVRDDDFVDSELFNELARGIQALSDTALLTIPGIYETLQASADQIVESAEDLTKRMSVCDDIIRKAEGNIKRKISVRSVKDEALVYDNLRSFEYITEGDLSIDRRTGFATLAVERSEEIPFTVEDVRVNVGKGELKAAVYNGLTWESVVDGYFHDRTFSENPVFENAGDADCASMSDGNLETRYLVEHNVLSETEPLTLRLSIAPPAGRIDACILTVQPADTESTLSSVVALPHLSQFAVRTASGQENMTRDLTDRRIKLRETVIGVDSPAIVHQDTDIYPTASYFLNREGIDRITIELSAPVPQEIYFPEKVVKNSVGDTLYRLNYLETLVMNGYEPGEGRRNPRDDFSDQELTRLARMIESGFTVEDEKIRLLRYSIGVKEISLKRYVFAPRSEGISVNLNASGRNLASVELYTSELLPAGTDIRYYVSADRVLWHELLPVGRAYNPDIPQRIVFEGIDEREGDLVLGMTVKDLYLKVVMTGSEQRTPVLKAYAVKLKLL